ncbi:MAG: hypothetical protein MUC36_20880 [Planctomycetes bacterium]|jgi:Zn-dependent protease|nr:hypothetical protein [Planctomycetota bacterium]
MTDSPQAAGPEPGADAKEAPIPILPRAAREAREALLAPRPSAGPTMLLLSLVLFVFVSDKDVDATDLAVIVGILLFHELGHLACMRLFGFRDLGMLFLPFLGAAVSGHKDGASAWERALVSLAGPLPGIVAAIGLLWYVGPGAMAHEPRSEVAEATALLVTLNLLNLVPVLPLDGGRVFEVLLFARWPWLDGMFRAATTFGIGWLAWRTESVAFGLLAALMLLGMRTHLRVGLEAARMRKQHDWPIQMEQLSETELLALHAGAVRATPSATLVRKLIPELYDRIARRQASLLQVIGLLLLWMVGVLLALGELVYVIVDPSRY